MQVQLSATVTPDNIDLLSELFFALGAETVTLTDAEDEPLFQRSPEDQPHWQQTTVHGLYVFDTEKEADGTCADIIRNIQEDAAFSKTVFTIKKLEDKNWVEETQKHFQPQNFGGLWVCPQWEKQAFLKTHANTPVIFIEPGLAFGTGTHPTTQLCLTWLATHDLKNKSVIDYGCGSGILAIAACAQQSARVYATDHDSQALESTINNARYNDFDPALLETRTTDKMHGVKADIIVANILANTLITLAPTLIDLLAENGTLVLSGVLREDVQRVVAAYDQVLTVTEIQYQQEWSLIELHY